MICPYCNRTPDQINEYVQAAADEGCSVEEFVEREEGTYNPDNGHFVCTSCWIKIGMPSSRNGWTCP